MIFLNAIGSEPWEKILYKYCNKFDSLKLREMDLFYRYYI